jgi:hypothetical protein
MEHKALEQVEASRKQWQAHQITSAQYADVLEKQILPEWSAERQNMEQLKVSREQVAMKQRLIDYLKAREQGWQLTVDGLRSGDEEKVALGAQKQAEANKLLRK